MSLRVWSRAPCRSTIGDAHSISRLKIFRPKIGFSLRSKSRQKYSRRSSIARMQQQPSDASKWSDGQNGTQSKGVQAQNWAKVLIYHQEHFSGHHLKFFLQCLCFIADCALASKSCHICSPSYTVPRLGPSIYKTDPQLFATEHLPSSRCPRWILGKNLQPGMADLIAKAFWLIVKLRRHRIFSRNADHHACMPDIPHRSPISTTL